MNEELLEEKIKDIVKDVVSQSHIAVAKVQSNQYNDITKKFKFGWITVLISCLVFLGSLVGVFISISNDIAVLKVQNSSIISGVSAINTDIKTATQERISFNTRISLLEGYFKSLGLKL